jgi:hypothetical protein
LSRRSCLKRFGLFVPFGVRNVFSAGQGSRVELPGAIHSYYIMGQTADLASAARAER